MKKQTKLVAVLSTAALLAIGASMTSFAATGWAEEDGTWVYYNRDGERATDSWKKSGNNWYYLDSDGEMAIDQLIEDGDNYYYVDINGVMASNQWVAIENEDAGEDDEPEHYWYYFQANGKALTNGDNDKVSLKTINGKKYAFDDEGKMLYGWVDEDSAERVDDTDSDGFKEGVYYFGGEDDGAMTVGWLQMDITYDEATNDNEIAPVFNDDEAAGNDELTGESVKGVITFKGDSPTALVKVAISSVSCENALANLRAELSHWDFDEVRNEAIDKWNDQLSCISIDTKDERAKKVFYTAMYHAFIAPTLYCDANGDFRGHDDKVYTNNTWKNYSTFSLWDTYRTLHPLFTIIKPQYVSDLVNSMLSIYDQQEKLPIWPLIGGETDQMPGYSAVPIIADAYLKGFTGFDADRAYRYMVASSVYEKQNGVPYVLEKGYIPCDKVREATSIAMEYAADDWGIALMAKKMGKTEDYQNYLKRGKYYTQYFDKDINFIRPKMNDGSWRTPYDPIQSIHSVGDFCEGNGWHYTFFVPQHPEGLIELMGGDAPFISKLDSLFLVEGELGENASPDISGLIGMYAHGNEPSHHVTYLYPYAGEQWKTAEKVRYIQDVFYTDQPEGIIGNEDCGQMSAWHIMSALGFYQVNPSNGVFVFGSPLFDKASVHLPEGKTFEVVAQNNSKENVYIQSVLLNGKPYNNSYILYDDIVKGGNLTFVMGSTPNKEFGAAPENRPKTAE